MKFPVNKHATAARSILFFLPFLALAGVEIAGRAQYRLRHGHPIQDDMAFAPHEGLVCVQRDNPFLIPSESHGTGRIRLWILGGSTSAPLPDQSDWPSQLARRLTAHSPGPAFVLNWARPGYGSGQINWLYDHHRAQVRPSAIIIFDGWNMRGAATSPYAPHPENTCTRFDGPARCFSAWLVRHSNVYARLAVVVHENLARRRDSGCQDVRDETAWRIEYLAWERELQATLAKAAKKDRVFIVLFPGLVMRNDAKDAVLRRFPCAGRQWDRTRADYALRIEALERIASNLDLPMLDARESYWKLSPDHFASLFTDIAHQTKEGNLFIGNSIYENLKKYGSWR